MPQQVIDAQRMVFDHLGLELDQRLTELQHYEAIDNHIRRHSADDSFLFLDIDCIFLEGAVVHELNQMIREELCIVGGIQNANHIPGSDDYASPACVAFTREAYQRSGSPSFAPTDRADCGAELTYQARENGVIVTLLPISGVEKKLWRTKTGGRFGHGTTYSPGIYHAFESRLSHSSRRAFIRKCQQVVSQ